MLRWFAGVLVAIAVPVAAHAGSQGIGVVCIDGTDRAAGQCQRNLSEALRREESVSSFAEWSRSTDLTAKTTLPASREKAHRASLASAQEMFYEGEHAKAILALDALEAEFDKQEYVPADLRHNVLMWRAQVQTSMDNTVAARKAAAAAAGLRCKPNLDEFSPSLVRLYRSIELSDKPKAKTVRFTDVPKGAVLTIDCEKQTPTKTTDDSATYAVRLVPARHTVTVEMRDPNQLGARPVVLNLDAKAVESGQTYDVPLAPKPKGKYVTEFRTLLAEAKAKPSSTTRLQSAKLYLGGASVRWIVVVGLAHDANPRIRGMVWDSMVGAATYSDWVDPEDVDRVHEWVADQIEKGRTVALGTNTEKNGGRAFGGTGPRTVKTEAGWTIAVDGALLAVFQHRSFGACRQSCQASITSPWFPGPGGRIGVDVTNGGYFVGKLNVMGAQFFGHWDASLRPRDPTTGDVDETFDYGKTPAGRHLLASARVGPRFGQAEGVEFDLLFGVVYERHFAAPPEEDEFAASFPSYNWSAIDVGGAVKLPYRYGDLHAELGVQPFGRWFMYPFLNGWGEDPAATSGTFRLAATWQPSVQSKWMVVGETTGIVRWVRFTSSDDFGAKPMRETRRGLPGDDRPQPSGKHDVWETVTGIGLSVRRSF